MTRNHKIKTPKNLPNIGQFSSLKQRVPVSDDLKSPFGQPQPVSQTVVQKEGGDSPQIRGHDG